MQKPHLTPLLLLLVQFDGFSWTNAMFQKQVELFSLKPRPLINKTREHNVHVSFTTSSHVPDASIRQHTSKRSEM